MEFSLGAKCSQQKTLFTMKRCHLILFPFYNGARYWLKNRFFIAKKGPFLQFCRAKKNELRRVEFSLGEKCVG